MAALNQLLEVARREANPATRTGTVTTRRSFIGTVMDASSPVTRVLAKAQPIAAPLTVANPVLDPIARRVAPFIPTVVQAITGRSSEPRAPSFAPPISSPRGGTPYPDEPVVTTTTSGRTNTTRPTDPDMSIPINPLTPSTGGASIPPNLGQGGLDLGETLVNAGCGFIRNPIARAACEAVGNRLVNRNANSGTSSNGQKCPPGYKADSNGVCRVDTLTQGRLPGDIGRPDVAWTPVAGLYGVGVSPVLVQSSKRACPAGFVLGKDGVCYERLARGHREHNPGAKPLLTGGDVNALRRAKQLQKTIGKLSRAHGKKPCTCKTSSRRKK